MISLFEVDSITREDLLNRIEKIKAERQDAEKKLAQLVSCEQQKLDLVSIEEELEEFCKKVKSNLDVFVVRIYDYSQRR